MDLPGWQVLRNELAPLGVEIVTVGLEMGGVDVLRPYIEDAESEHPSLIDEAHALDALFGVTNIPESIWIDEQGTIVRVRDSAVPPPVLRPNKDGEMEPYGMGGRYGRDANADAIKLRDWAAKGAESEFVFSPEEVISRSVPRPLEVSEAAAHFELAQHLWKSEGFSDSTFEHFARAHSLQPDNITYKRQAYSAYSFGRSDGSEMARFQQSPQEGEEWPFVSDFTADMAKLMAEREARQARKEEARADD
jgi:hypothetical protein